MEATWWSVDEGYELGIEEGKLACRNAAGKVLKSIPKKVRDHEVYTRAREFMAIVDEHARDCKSNVESWMLRQLPVPVAVLSSVISDPFWEGPLTNLIMGTAEAVDTQDLDAMGFFKTYEEERGLGLITIDGESIWVKADAVKVAHPVHIKELEDFRELALELAFEQQIAQLFREVFEKPVFEDNDDRTWLDKYDGQFDALYMAFGRARSLGYAIRGGWAVTRVFADDGFQEARYWLGSGDPTWETHVGGMCWVTEKGNSIMLRDVDPIAWSEGIRMAEGIWAARKQEEQEEEG